MNGTYTIKNELKAIVRISRYSMRLNCALLAAHMPHRGITSLSSPTLKFYIFVGLSKAVLIRLDIDVITFRGNSLKGCIRPGTVSCRPSMRETKMAVNVEPK